MQDWRSSDRTIELDAPNSTKTWEGSHTLDSNDEYSVNTTFNYIHYSVDDYSSQLQDDLADFVASAGEDTSVLTIELT